MAYDADDGRSGDDSENTVNGVWTALTDTTTSHCIPHLNQPGKSRGAAGGQQFRASLGLV